MLNHFETNNLLPGRLGGMNGYASEGMPPVQGPEDYFPNVFTDWPETEPAVPETDRLLESIETTLLSAASTQQQADWLCRPLSSRPEQKPRAKK